MQNAEPVQLRQVRDLGQIIATTFTFMRQNKRMFRHALFIALPFMLVGTVLMNYVPLALQGDALDPLHSGPFGPAFNTSASIVAYSTGLVMTLIGFTLLMASIHEYIRAYYLGESHLLTTGELFSRCWSQFGHYLALGFLMPLVVTICFILCILPGLFVGPILCLSLAAHAIERSGGFGSWSRSSNLVMSDFWATLGLFLLMWIIWYATNFVLQIPLWLVGGGIGFATGFEMMQDPLAVQEGAGKIVKFFSWFQVVAGILQSITYVFTMPIVCVSMCLKYFSRVEEKEAHGLRERMAGFDQV